MSLSSRFAMCAFIAFSLSACVTDGFGPSSSLTSMYNCGETSLSARQKEDDRLSLGIDGKSFDVFLTKTGSGARYQSLTSSPRAVFWSTGDSATLEVDGKAYPTCTRVKQSAYIDTNNYRAIGNAPSWFASINDNQLVLTTHSEAKTLTSPMPEPQTTLHGQYYSIKSDAHVMSMTIKNKPCQDEVTGQFYPHDVSIIFDGEVFKGCGTNLPPSSGAPVKAGERAKDQEAKGPTAPAPALAAQQQTPKPADLMNKTWLAQTIDGKPVLNAGRAVLTLEGDGKIVGSAGCNSFSGHYKLSGKSFRVDPQIASTMMGCEASVMAQETLFLDLLKAGTLVELRDGTLIISAPGRRTLTFSSSTPVWK